MFDFKFNKLSSLSDKNKSNMLQIKHSGIGVNNFEIQKCFAFSDIVNNCGDLLELRLYFKLDKQKSVSLRNEKIIKNCRSSFVDFFLAFYSAKNILLGKIKIFPNINILLSAKIIEASIAGYNLSDVSYVKISVTLKQKCSFNLSELSFSFVDFMSSNVFHDDFFNVDFRLRVNNLNKKRNGVIIFFPSFYVHGRNTDFPANVDHSVKWPNFTRYSWAENLRDYCTVFIADPLQFLAGNEKSSWFIEHKGKSLLPAIASKIKDMLGLNNDSCGPIINYGSSMGGYAAFLFSCYLKPDLCFAECPQANLTKYKYSLEYLKQYPELDYQKDIYNCLSFSKIIKEHKPEFKSLFHFYALDKLHLDNFNNEISQLTDEEIKKFNYSLVIENDVENGLSGHQAMPKEKVLKIFYQFLKR